MEIFDSLPETAAAVGFDTSAYTTSAAAVDMNGNILADARRVLKVRPGERGLRQSEALFQHIVNMPEVIDELMKKLRSDKERRITIKAAAASSRPRSEEGSYMPVFLAGINAGRNMAASLDIPYYEFSHQEGHIAAAAGVLPEDHRAMAFHLSGGTGEIITIRGCEARKIAGGTRDLSFGQLIDRIGVAYGLGFPAGAAMDRIACENREKVRWHRSLRGKRVYDQPAAGKIHVEGAYADLSGIETACQHAVRAGIPSEEAVPELFMRIADAIADMLTAACGEEKVSEVYLIGGVSASTFLRDELPGLLGGRGINVHFGSPRLSSDNAVGTARLAAARYRY